MTQFAEAQTAAGDFVQGAAPAHERWNLKKLLRQSVFAGLGVVAIAGAADLGWRYWTVGRFEISTDDAYVKADSTTIAPKVAGYIARGAGRRQ